MWQTATPQACVLLAGEHQSEEGWFHVSEDDVVSVLPQLPAHEEDEAVIMFIRDRRRTGRTPKALHAAARRVYLKR